MAFKDSLNGFFAAMRGNYTASGTNGAQNARKQTDGKAIVTQIVGEMKNRNRAEVNTWRQALSKAKDIKDPRLFLLQDLFDNLEADGHFISERELRKSASLCADYSIIEKDTGDTNQELTDFFSGEWFYNFREDALDSIIKGFTLLELTDPQTLEFKVVPRRNVAPTLGRVYVEVGGNKFVNFDDEAFKRTLIKVGKRENVGIMADLCGQLIWKRNAQQSWAEFTEKFGMPLITATTSKTAQADLDSIMAMLSEMAEAAKAVLPEGTTLTVTPFTGGDSFNVYDKLIERVNTEMSKPLVGGTMITDNGSSRSQSEVHERNLDDKIAARDKLLIEFVTNGQLLPMLEHWGYPINAEKYKFKYNDSFELTMKEHWEMVSDALNHYDIPDEWVSRNFGFPIDGRRTMQPFGLPTTATANGKPFGANFK